MYSFRLRCCQQHSVASLPIRFFRYSVRLSVASVVFRWIKLNWNTGGSWSRGGTRPWSPKTYEGGIMSCPPKLPPKKHFFKKVNFDPSQKSWVKSVEFSVLGYPRLGPRPRAKFPPPLKPAAGSLRSSDFFCRHHLDWISLRHSVLTKSSVLRLALASMPSGQPEAGHPRNLYRVGRSARRASSSPAQPRLTGWRVARSAHGSSEGHDMLKRNDKYHSIPDDVPIPKM